MSETALPGTLEEVVTSDRGDGRSVKGAAANAIALVLTADKQHVIGQVDETQVHVGVYPHLGEEAKERYRKNEMRLLGMDPRLLLGVLNLYNLCSMMEIEFNRELNQHHKIQKSKDDMVKAMAEAASMSPSLTEAVARGRITNQASPPAKSMARDQCMSLPLSPDTLPLFSSSLSSHGRRVAKGKKQEVVSQKRKASNKA